MNLPNCDNFPGCGLPLQMVHPPHRNDGAYDVCSRRLGPGHDGGSTDKSRRRRQSKRPQTAPSPTFMGLPVELRLMIYELTDVVVQPDPIELWPLSTRIGTDPVIKAIALDNLRKRMRPVIPLMLINKRAHREVASLFYGQNHFRFSGECGFLVLAAFLHTKRSYLADLGDLSVHAPFESPANIRARRFGLRFDRPWRAGGASLLTTFGLKNPILYSGSDRQSARTTGQTSVTQTLNLLLHECVRLRRLELLVPTAYPLHPSAYTARVLAANLHALVAQRGASFRFELAALYMPKDLADCWNAYYFMRNLGGPFAELNIGFFAKHFPDVEIRRKEWEADVFGDLPRWPRLPEDPYDLWQLREYIDEKNELEARRAEEYMWECQYEGTRITFD